MRVAEQVAQLRQDGALLVAAVSRADPAAPVPSCPEWTLRDLVAHVGGVHRWATSFVVTGRLEETTVTDDTAFFVEPPADLAGWLAEGVGALATALEQASDDLACFTFLPAPTPRAFWARRQAHETAIHRVDAELAAGGSVTEFSPQFAADGIAELLEGFYGRPGGRLRCDPPCAVAVETLDTGDRWWVRIGPDGREVRRGDDPADATVSGAASALYLLLWNRGSLDDGTVTGDAGVLDLWREKAHIRWS